MKKIFALILLLFVIAGCNTNKTNDKILTIYALNDFHGKIYSENGGLSRIGNYLINQRNKNEERTIILASGDMFQGTALSNLSEGKLVAEAMNEIGFSSMTIGNHEFDWGIDALKSIGEVANFPFLAANIFEKETGNLVDWAKPYTIVEKENLKIGIIGLIGSTLTDSISPSIVAPYEFGKELPIVKEYAKKLRTELGCDIVILSIHDDTSILNADFANLSGDEQIDAVFNGHSHANYHGEVLGSDGIVMPYVQSASVGEYIGKIEIKLNDQNKMIDGSAENIRVTKELSKENPKINAIIKKYDDLHKDVIHEVLTTSGTKISSTEAQRWAADVLKYYTNADISLINTGGIRKESFPIEKDKEITYSDVWEIMPFDNKVVVADMTVRMLITASNAGVQLSSNAKFSSGYLVMDGQTLDMDETIRVATIDYLFDNEKYDLNKGSNINYTNELFRDYLINYFYELKEKGEKFYAKKLY